MIRGGFQADLRLVAADSRGAALQYFTGSKPHNIALRDRALQSLEEMTGQRWPADIAAWQGQEIRPQPGSDNVIQRVGAWLKRD